MAAQKSTEEKKDRSPKTKKRIREKVLLSWQDQARPFKTRGREFWVSTIAIASVLGFILFLIEGVMPVILIVSVVFLFYVLSTVAPEKIEYQITNKGVKIADKRTDWDNISRFWFGKRFDSEILILETFTIPGRLELVVDSADKEKIDETIADYVEHEEGSPTNLDKAADWFSKRIPGY